MKSVSCLTAICGTVTLHAGVAMLAFRLLAQPDTPPTPEPVLIQAHLAPRALPVAPPLPAPTPVLAAPAAKSHAPSARPVSRPTPAKPVVKTVTAPAAPLPAPLAHTEALPAPAINPTPTVVAQPIAQPAIQAPAAPVRAGPSIPASYAASNRKPDYPLISRRYEEQGTVVLRVHVRADGSAGEVLVKTSSGYTLLDESAKNAVQGWRFNPASLDGKPIAEWYQLSIPFTLSNSLHN